jgi:hypothetical protein
MAAVGSPVTAHYFALLVERLFSPSTRFRDVYGISRDGVLINVASLAYLMEQCQSLKFVALQDLDMDENHCRVLSAKCGQTSRSC